MNLFLSSSSAAATTPIWLTLVYMVVIFGVFYLLLIRPQSKKRKKEEKMRSSVQIGDDITTIGGVVGKVVGIKEDSDMLIIETGTDRSKMKIKKWAIGSVDTIHDDAE
ncbi:MAG TPA: preprotein translocase subunit YajC [Caproicibacter sp.]|nr:preprotein translocase subunit YajC [Caproicibacter sp.]